MNQVLTTLGLVAYLESSGFYKAPALGGALLAGIILGLEVSRLARNNTDWHRLLEICALTDTLILDEDGVYDPAHFNDESCENGRPRCQIVSGKAIDEALSKLIVESVNPLALEVALSVQKELRSRLEEADRLRRAQVEGARFEADQAQRRYMRVDPANRLVADSGGASDIVTLWVGRLTPENGELTYANGGHPPGVV